jgi:hypothetical protein
MKIRFFNPYFKVLTFSAFLFTTACKKDAAKTNHDAAAASLSDSSTVADNAYNDVLVNAMFGYSDRLVFGSSGRLQSGGVATNATEVNRRADFSCANYTSSGDEYPITLTLDFGDGCSESADSIMRKGKIIYVFSGPLLTAGTTVSATFDHYYVNGYGLVGTCSIKNNSTQDDGLNFTVQVTNGIFTFPDLTNFHYDGNKTIKMTAGSTTPWDLSDDVYAISGNSNFSASDGTSLVSNITTPLVKTFICPTISAGVISFDYNQGLKGTIDFGDGTCDRTASLNVGSITRQINLR